MPSAIDELIKRKVIQQWFNGVPRDKIASDCNIGTGTVSGIINNYTSQLEDPDFESIRGLAIEMRKQGLNFADLSSLLRSYNFFKQSSARQDQIEAFIERVHSGGIPQDKIVEYVNHLYDISREQSIAPEHVPRYVKEKLEEKQKIDQDIKEANDVLLTKNANIEAIAEYQRLKEELDEHGVSIQDIDNLLNLLSNAKENGFDCRKIVSKLRGITRLEKKHDRLRKNCEILSTQVKECNNIQPLAQKMVAMDIDISGLLIFDTAVNEIAGRFNLPPSVAAHRLIGEIRDYKKIVNIKEELEKLSLQKYALVQACSHQALRALGNMQRGAIA